MADRNEIGSDPWAVAASRDRDGFKARQGSLLVGVILVVVIGLLRWPHPLSILTIVSLPLVLLSRLILPDHVDRMMKGVGALAVWIVEHVTVVVIAVLAIPLLYGPAAVAGLLRRRKGGDADAGWTSRTVSVGQAQRDARRLFSTTGSVAAGRAALGSALAGVVLVVALAVCFTSDTPADRRAGRDANSDDLSSAVESIPALEGVPYASALVEEQIRLSEIALVPDEVTGFSLGDFEGRWTTTKDGERQTVAPPPCATCPKQLVWLLGGSAAFGLGQRDDHTIASVLVREEAAHGKATMVRNLAVPGWTIDQITRDLRRRLRQGEEQPDLVVLVDGFNDVLAHLGESLDMGVSDAGARLSPDALSSIRQATREPGLGTAIADVGGAQAIGREAAERYEPIWHELTKTLEDAGIGLVRFTQPDALAERSRWDEIADSSARTGLPTTTTDLESMAEVFAAADSHLDGYSLRGLYSSTQRPVFTDMVHTNEIGASLVAAAIRSELR